MHEHVHVYDHDHDRDDVQESIEDNPIWQQDNVTLHSVGIDIGSSGTLIAFSRLHLRRLGEDLTSRYVVVRRDTLFESEIQLTPYLDETLIDAEALGAIIDTAYVDANCRPEDIDTGVVILTGEALRRRNSSRIAEIVAVRAGDLVCASAGHHMEAMLAAYGSGAVFQSHTDKSRILNIDIGGGTTKLALIESGRVRSTAAFHVGGRLQVVDPQGRIVRLAPAGRRHALRAGFGWEVGDTVSSSELDDVAEAMADAIVAATSAAPRTEETESLFLTDPIASYGHLDGIMFSGGVSEYIYEREANDFGDLGRRLGAALRRRISDGAFPAPLLPAGECIRATVLGASEYSVQLSGNTCYIPAPEKVLPRRNLQVIRPHYEFGETVDSRDIAEAIRSHLKDFDVDTSGADVALALEWNGAPAYERLSEFARGIAAGLAARISGGLPVYLLFEADVARTVGLILKDELGVTNDLMVIDGVRLGDFDYIDLGTVRWPSNTVPVTIKSLIFMENLRSESL